MKTTVLLLLLVAIAAVALAAPRRGGGGRGGSRGGSRGSRRGSSSSRHSKKGQDTCSAAQCSGVSSRYQLEEGKEYKFDYAVENKVYLGQPNQEQTSIKLSAVVGIQNNGNCDYALKMYQVSVEGHDVGSQYKNALEASATQFAFDDGIVRGVCPSGDEPWVVNIKRGVISAFQNSLEGSSQSQEVVETDIVGKCPTKYSVGRNGIEKTKNLVQCENHRGLQSSLRGVPYSLRSKMQNSPLITSTQKCTQKIGRSNVLEESVCTEKHEFNPLDDTKQAKLTKVTAETKQTLKLQGKTGGSIPSPAEGEKQSLEFDHSEFESQISRNAQAEAQQILGKISQTDDVRPETPSLFTELVYSLRKMDYRDMKTLYEQSKGNQNQKKPLLDAVPMCGSSNCVKLMALILREKGLSEKEAKSWGMSFSLVPNPTKDMVETLIPLITSSSATLGISSLVRGYAVKPGASQAVVERAVSQLTQTLGSKCQGDKEKVIIALKGIGNIGTAASAVPTLVACLEEASNPVEVRLAAIQALRRMPCDQNHGTKLMTMFKSQDKDVELRLVSFMTAMQCPTSALVQEITQTLETEPINQVTSFVWSFLKEKKSTSDPTQHGLAKLLRSTRLSYKYNRDPRRYSRFYEHGYFNMRKNIGAQADAAWIFSPESYIPKQGFVNLTLHMFGNSFNLLEIGGRTEGLDHFLHKLYGPDGYFTNANAFMMAGSKKPHSNPKVRKFEDFYKKQYPMSKRQELSLSMYMKVFGDEVAYKQVTESGFEQKIQEAMDVEKIMKKLKNANDISINKNLLFLDTTITVPTSTGIPLRLSLNGTASIRLQFQSKFNMANSPILINMEGNLVPSAAIEMNSMMSFQTGALKSGIKQVTKIHTSSSVKGLLEIGNGKFKTKIELPKEKMEIIGVRSELLKVKNNQESTIQSGPQKKDKFCTPESLGRLVGLKMCAEMQISKNAPFSGPFAEKVTIEKADPSLQSYEASIEVNPGNPFSGKVELNTPGSQVDRLVKLEFEHEPMKRLTAQLRVPGKHLGLTGTLNEQGSKQTGRLSLTIDRKDTYAVSASLTTSGSAAQGSKYEFEGEAVRPSKSPINIQGTVQTPGSAAQRTSAEFQIENLYSTPVETKFVLDVSAGKYSKINLEGKVKCPAINADLAYAGGVEKDGAFNYKLNFEYKTPEDAQPHKILLSQTQKVKQEGEKYELVSQSNVESSWFPQYNSASTFTLTKDADSLETRLQSTYSTKKQTLELHQVTRHQKGGTQVTNLNANWPQMGLNHQAKITYKNQPNDFLASVELDTPKMKDIIVEAKMKQGNKGGKMNVDAQAKLQYPGREMMAKQSINELRKNEYKTSGVLQWQKGEQVQIDATLKLKKHRNGIEYEIEAEGKKSGEKTTIKLIKKLKQTPKETKFVGSLSSDNKYIYNSDFELTKSSPNKQEVKVQASSDFANFNYGLDGSLEQHRAATKVMLKIKKDTQEFAKGEFMFPTNFKMNSEKKLKAHITWDLQSPQPNELLGKYVIVPKGKDRTHTMTTKIKYGRHNYGTMVEVKKEATQYTMDVTAKSDGKPMLEADVNMKHPDSPYGQWYGVGFSFDSSLKTSKPLSSRHYTAKLGIDKTRSAGLSGPKVQGEVKCHMSGNKVGFSASQVDNMDGGKRGTAKTVAAFKVYANEMSIEGEHNFQGASNSMKSNAEFKVTWAPSSAVVLTSDVEAEHSGGRPGELKKAAFKLTTPFEKFSEGNVVLERVHAYGANEQSWKYEISWNKEHSIKETMSFSMYTPKGIFYSSQMETTFEALRTLNTNFRFTPGENDVKPSFEASIDWNTQNKLRAFLEIQPPTKAQRTIKINTETEAKIQGKLDTELKVGYSASDKDVSLEGKFRWEKKEWSGKANLNYKDSAGTIELNTPQKSYKNVKLTVEKQSDGYVVTTEKNGQTQIEVSASLKTSPHTLLEISVDKNQYPFVANLESYKGPQKIGGLLKLTLSPNKPTKKVYGFKAYTESGEKGIVELEHPKRKMFFKVDASNASPARTSVKFELQTNAKSGRAPTSLEIVRMERGNKRIREYILSDPSLPNDLKVQTKKVDNCQSPSKCDKSLKITFDPAKGDKKKIVEVDLKLNSEQSPIACSRNYELGVKHEGLNILYKTWLKYSSTNCQDGSMCQLEVELGDQFKHPRTKQIQQGTLGFNLDKEQRTAKLEVTTPEATYKAESMYKYGKLITKLSQDSKPVAEVVIRYDTKYSAAAIPTSLEVATLKPKRKVLFHVSARLINKDHFRFRLWHTEGSRKVEDVEISLKLTEADLLTTKFYVRPGLDRELSFAMKKAKEQLGQGSPKAAGQSPKYSSFKESEKRLRSEFSGHIQPLMDHYNSEKNTMAQDLGPAVSEIQEKVELYAVMTKEFFLSALDIIDMSLTELTSVSPSQAFGNAYDSVSSGLSAIPESVAQMMAPLKESVESMSQGVSKFQAAIGDMAATLQEKTQWNKIKSNLNAAYNELKESPIVRQLIQWITGVKNQLESMELGEVKESVKEYYNKAEKQAKGMAKQAEGVWNQWKDTVMEYEIGRALIGWLKESYGKAKWTYDYVNPKGKLEDFFDGMISKTKTKSWKEMLPTIEKNPEEGIYIVKIPLPTEVKSLEQLGDAFHPSTFSSLKDEVQDQLQGLYSQIGQYKLPEIPESAYEEAPHGSIFDYLDAYQPQWKSKDLTPPFKSKALLAGAQHFVTFDGKTFDFKANCEYLLARDFHDGKFLISAKYGSSGLQSIKVESSGQEVELTVDGKAKVGGRVVEFPWQKVEEMTGEVQVQVKRKDHSACIKTSDDIKVKCHFYYNSCSISIAGHYHAKSRGLLGTNDNEPSNDFTKSDGKVTNNLDEFVNSWVLSGSSCRNSVAKYSKRNQPEVCADFFKSSSSPFRPCFHTVSPVPFYKMCSVYVTEKGGDRKAACAISSSYIYTCKMAGISMDQASDCIECDVHSKGSITEGQDARVEAESSPKVADVVFVVEQSTEFLAKNNIVSLAQKIKTELSKKSLKDIKFGLIGFNGEGAFNKPHFQTGGSAILFDASQLQSAVNNLQYGRSSFSTAKVHDPMQALSKLAKYFPFRSASEKIAILIADSSNCKGKTVGYYDLQSDLLNAGITFHLVTSTELELEDESSANVAGFDAVTMYAGRGKANLAALRSALRQPHDHCTALAQETAGTVFPFASGKAGQQVNVLSKKVAEKMTGPKCQICECQVSCKYSNTPRTFCYPCEIPRPVSLTKGSSSMFNIVYKSLGPKKSQRFY